MTTTEDSARWKRLNHIVDSVGLSLGLIALAALSSSTLPLASAPVSGAIQSQASNGKLSTATFLLGVCVQLQGLTIGARLPISQTRAWLPVLAVLSNIWNFTPFISSALPEYLGISLSSFVGSLLSFNCVTFAVAFEASTILRQVKIDGIGDTAAWIYKSAFAIFSFALLEKFFTYQVPLIITHSSILSPADIQLIVAAAFALLCGDQPVSVVVTWALIVSSFLFNPNGNGLYARSVLDAALAKHNWTLLDRKWSTTGYISVIENQAEQYRALRCDHSLLGGEWLINDERRSQGWTRNESIYSVFAMLEAVRLIDTSISIQDVKAQALVIGLGVGTAPKAFIEHGIDTTIVELDPAVYSFAKTYFNLPSKHKIVLQDATTYLHNEAAKDTFDKPRYDYIIHDVFTGGAEPLPLFTTTFLHDLRSLLKDDGVAAINYAGDLTMPLTRTILNTIDRVFDRQCQIYSDDGAREDGETENFSNFVVFCRNSPGEISFRKPTDRDLQGSLVKRSHLYPMTDQRVDFPLRDSDTAETDVLETKSLRKWGKAQEESASKHWQIMRGMIPARVWEMY